MYHSTDANISLNLLLSAVRRDDLVDYSLKLADPTDLQSQLGEVPEKRPVGAT